jgi:predicted RNA-binding Zn-ribbon protein involved in translation (DUF1610 family)
MSNFKSLNGSLKCPSCGAAIRVDPCEKCHRSTRAYKCPDCGVQVKNPEYIV